MKILYCSPCRLDRTLGAAQTLMDLAEELESLGWQCDLIGPDRLGVALPDYPAALQAYLKDHASAYDIVDFDYKRLPFSRAGLPADTLFVARCQLLIHHYQNILIPPLPTLRSRLRAALLGPRDRKQMLARIERATASLQAADIAIVLNQRDQEALVRHGVPEAKIHVVPNGMTQARLDAFGSVSADPPEGALVAFIGSFGPRKGAADFPDLVRRLAMAVPEVRFRLLGTRGMLKTAEEVHTLFPASLRSRIEVIPSFAQEKLPDLLASCAVGVFPSYVEGFGLGVLEMLAAAVPVVAYDAPGPPAMLPPSSLVPLGDTAAMSQKVAALLQDRAALAEARRWAQQRAQAFTWPHTARQLAAVYEQAMTQKRAQSPTATS